MKYLFFSALLALSVSSFAQVGIGTPTPNAKAALDITSTTQGFLPPRMNSSQRTGITSPPAGLLVYQTDLVSGLYYYTGSLWTIVNASSCGYAIGQNNGSLGGYIFYLDQSGCHGLVAAPTDQSTGIQWYAGTNTNTTAFASAVGGGDGNTNMIVYIQAGTLSTYAAGICYALSTGGFTDWYLPSKYELNLMYLNIGQGASAPNTNVGGFTNMGGYWSSSEGSGSGAWFQVFDGGDQNVVNKDFAAYVRAIRAF